VLDQPFNRAVDLGLAGLDRFAEGTRLTLSLLDKAVWRRFDEILRFELPSLEQIKRLLSLKLSGIRRNFEADDGGFDYGDEVDLQAVKKFGNHYTVGLKYADYDADQNAMNVGLPSVDAEKFWLWLEVAF
jgi:SpoVK/Ycf46/Vps4 family AAA+-type ATPase